MSLPYYKRFPRDFLEGTIGLSFEAKGAYAIVLDLIYMRDGRLPDDARYIAGQLGCSVRKWTAIFSDLVQAGKLQVSDGIITNFRADYLTEESRKYQDKQSEIAGKPRKNKAVSQPKPNQSEPETYREAKASLTQSAGEPKTRATRRCPPSWAPSPADLQTVTDLGFSPGEIERELATIRDFEFGTARSDWSATFRNWFRREAKHRKPANVRPDRYTAQNDHLSAVARAMAAACDRTEGEYRPDRQYPGPADGGGGLPAAA